MGSEMCIRDSAWAIFTLSNYHEDQPRPALLEVQEAEGSPINLDFITCHAPHGPWSGEVIMVATKGLHSVPIWWRTAEREEGRPSVQAARLPQMWAAAMDYDASIFFAAKWGMQILRRRACEGVEVPGSRDSHFQQDSGIARVLYVLESAPYITEQDASFVGHQARSGLYVVQLRGDMRQAALTGQPTEDIQAQATVAGDGVDGSAPQQTVLVLHSTALVWAKLDTSRARDMLSQHQAAHGGCARQ